MGLKWSKPSILFDIDCTLIDGPLLKRTRDGEISRILAISKPEAEKLSVDFARSLKSSLDFSPRKLIDFLIKKTGKTELRSGLEDLFFRRQRIYRRALYPEVKRVLKKLRKDFSLGIFSEGIEEYQRAKLSLSGIGKYLDESKIFIFKRKKGKMGEIVKKLGEVIVVDDNPIIVREIARTKGVFSIWIKRGPRARADFPFYRTIKRLDDLEKFL